MHRRSSLNPELLFELLELPLPLFVAASFAAWSFFWSAMISASVRFDG